MRYESGRPKHARTEENVTTVDELVGPLSQEGRIHHSTRQIFIVTGLTQCSIVQIIHRDLGSKYLSCPLSLVFLTLIFHKVV